MSESVSKQLEFWSETFWSTGNLPWHLKEPNEFLVRHLDKLLNGRKPQDITILVPLCGKSIDLLFLKDQGFNVIGVEGNRLPINEFSRESGISFRETTSAGVIVHESQESEGDAKLKIIQADFLTLNIPELEGSIDYVWDRAALNAIQVDHRGLYIKTMQRYLKGSEFRYLLSAYEYDASKGIGPPYSLPYSDVFQMFQDFAEIHKLEEKKIVIDDGPMIKLTDEVDVNEVIYLLTSRSQP